MDTNNRDPRTFEIIGAGMELHSTLGDGFLEVVYREGLVVEFTLRKIPFMTEVPFPITYKGHRLAGNYRPDFVCYNSVIVEVKATATKSSGFEQAQMINYLKASGLHVGVLLNFGGSRLEYRRVVLGEPPMTEVISPR
jgi:GxxExxY protein